MFLAQELSSQDKREDCGRYIGFAFQFAIGRVLESRGLSFGRGGNTGKTLAAACQPCQVSAGEVLWGEVAYGMKSPPGLTSCILCSCFGDRALEVHAN